MVYQYCDEDYLERFGALSKFFQQERRDNEWMSPAQAAMTYIFAFLCIVAGIVACVACMGDIMPHARRAFDGTFVSCLSVQFLASAVFSSLYS